MKTIKKNNFKVFVLILAAVFISQTLWFGLGKAYAETSVLSAVTPYVSALANVVPVEIKNEEDMIKFLNNEAPYTDEKYVIISGGAGTKIDLTGKESLYNSRNLEGVTFDGNFCTIMGLNKPLFGTVSTSTIEDVYIGSGTITSNRTNTLGAIAKESSNSKFINCINNASITLTASSNSTILYAGGIVGKATGASEILKCSNHANISVGVGGNWLPKEAYAGGIVGYASGTTKVENCYVVSKNENGTSIKIEADALAKDTIINKTVINKNADRYYNGLTHVWETANEDINKWKREITGYQDEVTGINKDIQDVKNAINNREKTIQNYENKIASIEKQIKNKTKEANNSFLGAAWVWIGPEILILEAEILGLRAAQALERVAQGALWVTVGALEATRAVVFGFITALQALITGAATVISHVATDANWINFTADGIKHSYEKPAYAYGIGYMASKSNNIKNVYTHKIQTTGGSRTTIFTLPLKFWSKSEFALATGLIGNFSSDPFETKLTFVENNFYGPISNHEHVTIKNAYFFDNSYVNNGSQIYKNHREIYIESIDDGTAYKVGNWYGKKEMKTEKHSIYVSFEKQQLIISTTGKNLHDITLYVNNGRQWISNWFEDYAGVGTKFYTFTFYGSDNLSAFSGERTMVGDHKAFESMVDSRKISFVKDNLDEKEWGYQDTINDGLPYLKCRYWQEIEG